MRRFTTCCAVSLTAIALLTDGARATDLALAAEIGITPESACVADLSEADAAVVLQAIDGETELQGSIAQAKADADAVVQSLSQLSDELVNGDPDESDVSQHQAALAELDALKAQIEQLKQQLFDTVTATLSLNQIERLEAWRQSPSHRTLPQFRVAQRTSEQWNAIQLALIAEARAIRLGEDVPAEHAAVLAAVRAEPAVIEAENNLTLHLLAMEQLFALHDE